MMIPLRPTDVLARMVLPDRRGPVSKSTGELFMKWETPQAIDFRFGMEITMYIAHR